MKALYRTISALLAILSGLVLAALITAVIDDREIKALGFTAFAVGALIAAVTALVLWSRSLRK